MLIAALGLVVVGFAFLVVSLVTENSAWAWGCILACVAAAVVLVVETRGRRARGPATAYATPAHGAAAEDDQPTQLISVPGAREEQPTTVLPASAGVSAPSAPAPVIEPFVPLSGTSRSESAPVAVPPPPVVVPLPPVAVPPPPVVDDAEPAEEDADASDILVVAGLEQAVLVVDEHPRFHVPDCGWLAGRPTMSLAAREAVELGFTPCSRCAPARTLASMTRA